LTGSGPATVMLVEEDKVSEFVHSMDDYTLMTANIYNGRSKT